MILYKVVNPLKDEPIYIGAASDLDAARKGLYATNNPGLATEICEIRAQGHKPVFIALETPPHGRERSRKKHWIAFHREMGFKLHNEIDKNAPLRYRGRRRERKVHSGEFSLVLPVALIENKVFKEFIGYTDHKFKLLSARITQLLTDKIEELTMENLVMICTKTNCKTVKPYTQFWYKKTHRLTPVRETYCLACTHSLYEWDEETRLSQRFGYYYTVFKKLKPRVIELDEIVQGWKGLSWPKIVANMEQLMREHLTPDQFEEITWQE